MKALGRALVSFVRRPAVAMACVSLMEHATVCFVDTAIIKLKRWEESVREFDNVVTIKGS